MIQLMHEMPLGLQNPMISHPQKREKCAKIHQEESTMRKT